MFRYPYGNNSNLNLDWLLTSWRDFQRDICQMIAPAYDNSSVYPAGSLVLYNMGLFTNPDPIITAEDFNPDHWTQTTLAEIIQGGT